MSQAGVLRRPKLHLKCIPVRQTFTKPAGLGSAPCSPRKRGSASSWPIYSFSSLKCQEEAMIRVWKRLYVATATLPQRHNPVRIMGDLRGMARAQKKLTNLVELEAFVTRAKSFGIVSMQQLLVQSDVAKTPRSVSLLVRRPEFETNADLWCLLLEFRHALDGDSGVRGVWSVMKDRMAGREAFHNGPTADRIWGILIPFAIASTDNQSLLRSLCNIEFRNGALRRDLYVDILGGLLDANQPDAAIRFSQILQNKHAVQRSQLLKLFNQACASKVPDALGNFCKVYGTLPKMHLYEPAILQLCRVERVSDALAMHKAMLSLGDVPVTFEQIRPLIGTIGRDGANTKDLLQDLKRHGIGFEGQIQELLDQQSSLRYGIASGTLNVVTSTTFGRQPTRLSDDFVARAFATSAFSFDFILSGLRLLGLRELGPQALRQIGLQSSKPEDLRSRLATLADNGVDTGSSTFTRVVIESAKKGQAVLLRDVLESDQHPDVFEDVKVQKALLRQYYHRQDWRQIDRTLAVLSVVLPRETEVESDILLHNMVLKSAIEQKDWVSVSRLMAQGRARNWPCTRSTMKRMYNTILGERAPGQRVLPDGSLAELRLLLQLWQEVIHSKTFIPPEYWREPIRRLGILGQWPDLVDVLPWLARQYGSCYWSHEQELENDSDGHGSAGSAPANQVSPSQALATIFSVPQQRAIVEWPFLLPPETRYGGQSLLFRSRTHSHFAGSSEIRGPGCAPIQTTPASSSSESEDSLPVWTEGVRLLRFLHVQHDVSLSKEEIRRVCLHRLRILFSRNSLSRRILNMRIRKTNSIELRTYLFELEKAWDGLDGPLFPDIRAAYRHARRPKQMRQQDFRRLQDSAYLRSVARNKLTLPGRYLAVMSLRQTDTSLESQALDTEGTTSSEMDESDPVDEVVMYRDLFTASNTDYERQAAAKNAKP